MSASLLSRVLRRTPRHSQTRKQSAQRRTRRLLFESVESRVVLASDYAVAVDVASQNEGNVGVSPVNFTITRTDTAAAGSVQYSLGGTATSGVDFNGLRVNGIAATGTTGTINFAAGQSTGVVSVNVVGDVTAEANETILLTLSNPSAGGTISTASATSTIVNDEATVSVDASAVSISEDASGNATFTLTRTGVLTSPLTVNVALTGAAIANTDFTQTGVSGLGTVTFGANQATATITIDPTLDATFELDEDVTLTVLPGLGYTVAAGADATASIDILNDDLVVIEGNTSVLASGVVSIAGGPDAADFSIGAGGALNFTVAPDFDNPADANLDNVYEVTVNVNDGQGGTTALELDVRVTATNAAPIFISPANVSVAENTTLAANVQALDANVGQTVAYSITGGADASLFTINPTTGALTFNTAANFEAPADAGANNVYNVQVTATDSLSATAVQDLAITVTDAASLSINNVTQLENGPVVFTVTLNEAVAGGLSVNFNTSNVAGGAIAGVDYVATNGTLNFTGTAGETRTITVNVINETLVEANEQFHVNLSGVNVSGGGTVNLTTAVGVGTIISDDNAHFEIYESFNFENGISTTFYVQLLGEVDVPLTVDFATQNIAGGATAGVDYTAVNGTLTFSGRGGEFQTFVVPFINDNIAEADEQFRVVLSNIQAQGRDVYLDPATAIGIIRNDDTGTPGAAQINVSAEIASQNEGNVGLTPVIFNVTRTNAAAAGSVNYTLSGTATSGVDFQNVRVNGIAATGTSGTINFAAGQSTAVVSANIVGDTNVEADETIILTLSNPSGSATIGAGVATTTIINDEATVSVDVSQVAISEDAAGNATFTLTRTGSLTSPLTVNVLATGTATASIDFSQTGISGLNTVTFGANQATATVTINPSADATFETDETVILTVLPGVGYTVAAGADATATLEIANDDLVVVENNTQVLASGVVAITGGPDAADFTIGTGGSLNFAVAPDFDNPADANLDNVYEVTVTVNDGQGGTTTLELDVRVTATNSAPVFTSPANISVAENTTVAATVVATDENGEEVTYSITGGADASLFTINPTTGVLSFNTAANFEAPADAGANNVYNVQITATDESSATAVQNLAITVTDTASLSINNVTQLENGPMVFTVTLNEAVAGGLTVDFETVAVANGATPGVDYVEQSGTLTFNGTAGETKTITVNILNETLVEANEQLQIVLSNAEANAVGASVDITTAVGTGTIISDDNAHFEVYTSFNFENGISTTFYVQLLGESDVPLTVDFATQDIAGGATAGVDYTAVSGTLSFSGRGGEFQTFVVPFINDNIFEADEQFRVVLSNVQSQGRDVYIDPATAIGIIRNDDPQSAGAQVRVDEFTNGQSLFITGGANNDTITVNAVAGQANTYRVNINGQNTGDFVISGGSSGRIYIDAGAGNDNVTIDASANVNTFIRGGTGNDVLRGGAGSDVLLGEDGDDKLFGLGGRDLLIGGLGRDELYGNNTGSFPNVNASDENILIGNAVIHNDYLISLNDIIANFNFAGSFAARTQSIFNGTPTGGIRLDSSAVIDDNAVDQLFHGSGPDWYLDFEATATQRDVTNLRAGVDRLN